MGLSIHRVVVFLGIGLYRIWMLLWKQVIVFLSLGLLYSKLYQINLLLIRMFSLHSPPVHMSVNRVTHTYCSCAVLDGLCSFLEANFDICLCSVVADPLNKPPELLEFLSQVASKANKWEMIGLVSTWYPRSTIIPCSATLRYSLHGRTKPAKFTWMTIVEALKSPVVEENN